MKNRDSTMFAGLWLTAIATVVALIGTAVLAESQPTFRVMPGAVMSQVTGSASPYQVTCTQRYKCAYVDATSSCNFTYGTSCSGQPNGSNCYYCAVPTGQINSACEYTGQLEDSCCLRGTPITADCGPLMLGACFNGQCLGGTAQGTCSGNELHPKDRCQHP